MFEAENYTSKTMTTVIQLQTFSSDGVCCKEPATHTTQPWIIDTKTGTD